MANANQVIVNGETILDLRSDTVTPETLQKGYTAHDKSGTKITGTLEASSSGGAKETWVLKETCDDFPDAGFVVDFVSNAAEFHSITLSGRFNKSFNYDNTSVATAALRDTGYQVYGWANSAYRKLTFDAPPTGDLLTWLQANGVKQPDNTAVQDTKALTITSNGTVSITPDAPYDALKKVDVTVDVASGAGFKVTFPATATNWDKLQSGGVVQADGAVISMIDYSTLAGKTIPNVVEICSWGMRYQCLRMTVQTGKIMLTHNTNLGIIASIVADGESSITYMGDGSLDRLVPMADTVISAIEMYNTD